MLQRMLNEDGATTAEYVIITLAAVGFAGLLLSILRSEEVKAMLLEIVRGAITPTGG
jgi:Flp pilus assembly pilin Flp